MSCAGNVSGQARVFATCAREKRRRGYATGIRVEGESKKERKVKERVPYKVAVSWRPKLRLLNDFEPRPAVSRWDGGKNGDLVLPYEELKAGE